MRRLLGAAVLVGLVAAPMPVAATSAVEAPTLTPCRGVPGAVCGSIVRPLDPTDPDAGGIEIAFELHRARSGAPEGTIVAVEGGPGYASTASRDYYLALFEPLLSTRDLLLVDNRGTGGSGAIDCPELQSYEGDYLVNVGLCGSRLGETSDLYGTAFAADDLAAVLDALGIDRIDLYGDSYGTFFAQSFALRHPDRLRTLTLDAAYPVEDQDPWYRDLNRAMRDAITSVCAEDPGCGSRPGDPVEQVARLADALRASPITGRAYDADGVRREVTVDAAMLAYLYGVAAYGTTVYEELDAAGRAWSEGGDPAPLLRIAAEQTWWGDAGAVEEFSEGLYVAVICNDYPQHWDISSPIETRPAQYDEAVAALRTGEPDAFAPFTIDDWLESPWTEYRSCINWPAPSSWLPPEPDPAVYPPVPTLVLAGELDSLTSPEGAAVVAGRFPESRLVAVANTGHVTALSDYLGCAAGIVVGFVAEAEVGDTSCAATYPPVRTTDQFPRRLADVAVPDGAGSPRQRQVTVAAVETVGDLWPRWYAMYGTEGRGLRGGRFTTSGFDTVRFGLDRLRWVSDLTVSGRVRWDRAGGDVTATVDLAGAATGRLRLAWNEWDRHGQASVTGTIDGERIELTVPAP
jgi:pimeloyl-ACP methyl ester carboxylesterase